MTLDPRSNHTDPASPQELAPLEFGPPPDPFNGNSSRGFLTTTRQRIALGAVLVAGVIGLAEATTHVGSNAVRDYHDNHTLVDNPYSYPAQDAGESVLPTDPFANMRVTIAELRHMRAEDKKAATAEQMLFDESVLDFNDSLALFKGLNKDKVAKAQSDQEKVALATDITTSLNSIMDFTQDQERDGAKLFKDIVDDETQELLKHKGITVESDVARNSDDPSFVNKSDIFIVQPENGKIKRITILFTTDYPNKNKPEGSIAPDDQGFTNHGTREPLQTELGKTVERIEEERSKLMGELQALRDKVAEKRITRLIDKHPSLAETHERHTKESVPGLDGTYSASAELERLRGILEDRKYRAELKRLKASGKPVLTPSPPESRKEIPEAPKHPGNETPLDKYPNEYPEDNPGIPQGPINEAPERPQ